ncbi:molecular chaperone HtpG [Pseudonocardia eucalypti]|uniref:Chaperone protein HtpG n=1 Tax=Pseudonocardia eucalypti TaxID=648755 RepID=A0ABP9Q5V9_9PSEU|nr:molecular chaperone HtpG [Pseudonocardia eucalypti]
MSTATETREFQTEARELLRLMVHSIYSNKDIFLRELISNASDALDKLRLEAYRDKDLEVDQAGLRIELEADAQARTLTVRDNGIGMTRDEVVGLIGTIAKSGTAEYLRKLKEAQNTQDAELIGQFGVGFYSSFMVADKVTLTTRRAGADAGVRWESAGEGTYTIEDAPDAPRGTEVRLHLKPVDAEDHLYDYSEPAKIKEIVKRYSDFITWPIQLDGETVNSRKALWARSRDDVGEEEYAEFYRHISHDWTDPLETIRLQAEGTFEYQALLFIPARAPLDLFMRDAKAGVQLYVKRVFIMDDCDALMPEYLRFVKGVVDAADLSLNVSREILQQDRQIQLIRRRLVKKVLATVKTMLAEEPDKYATFWGQFARPMKEGLLADQENQAQILEICSFASTHDAERPTTLADYASRMKDGQEHIYYLTGETRAAMENSPHMEAFRAKGFEVLLLDDPIDGMWVEAVPEFGGKPFQSIAKGQVDLDSEEEKRAAQGREEEFAGLLAWLTETLGEQVKQVRLSSRLTTSAACIVSDSHDLTPTLEKIYRASGQDLPPIKRILELNPGHPLVAGLRTAQAEGRGDAEAAELLYSLALLAEGGELADPARFVKLVTSRLEQGL